MTQRTLRSTMRSRHGKNYEHEFMPDPPTPMFDPPSTPAPQIELPLTPNPAMHSASDDWGGYRDISEDRDTGPSHYLRDLYDGPPMTPGASIFAPVSCLQDMVTGDELRTIDEPKSRRKDRNSRDLHTPSPLSSTPSTPAPKTPPPNDSDSDCGSDYRMNIITSMTKSSSPPKTRPSGPNLSESDSDEPENVVNTFIPVPTMPMAKPCVAAEMNRDRAGTPSSASSIRSGQSSKPTRKRQLSSSPEPFHGTKRMSKVAAQRQSRPRTRKSRSDCRKSSSSSDSYVAPDFPLPMTPRCEPKDLKIKDFVEGPPPTPNPVVSTAHPFHIDSLLDYVPTPVPRERDPSPYDMPPPTPGYGIPPTPGSGYGMPPTPGGCYGMPPTPAPVVYAPPPTPGKPRKKSPSSTKLGVSNRNPKKPQCMDLEPFKPPRFDELLAKRDYDLMNVYVPTTEPIPGIIKSIKMTNIMSHKNFSMKWNESMNFIIGENGTGKSAILSAIVAGLGGRAEHTGRTNSMKGLITNGMNKARVEIVLHSPPVKPNDSDEITIIRHFAVGSSRYQIKDQTGQVRSLSREELDLLLSRLNIQVTNPLAVLHQEMSRNFLKSKNPKTMYEHFSKALLLDACKQCLDEAGNRLQASRGILKEKENLLAQMREMERKQEAKWTLLHNLHLRKSNEPALKNKLSWVKVKEAEVECSTYKNDLEIAQNMLEKADRELQTHEASIKEIQETLSRFGKEHQELQRKKMEKKKEYESRRKELLKASKDAASLQKHLESLTARIQGLEYSRVNTEKRIKETAERNLEAHEKNKRNTEERINHCNAQLVQIDKNLIDAREELNKAVQNLEAVRLTNKDHLTKKNAMQKELETINKELHEINETIHAQNSHHNVYGKEMVKLIKRVNDMERRFRKKPRGPLGVCFTVKEKKWAALIEYVLHYSLYDFAVDNKEDLKLLKQIIEEIYPKNTRARKPSVCLMEFGDRRHDVREGKAQCKHPTILDLIETSDYVVYNWLVDSHRVERLLLFDTYGIACDFMKNGNIIPKTTNKGYTLDAYVVFPDPRFKALVQYHVPTLAKLLRVSQAHQLESLKNHAVHLQSEHSRLLLECNQENKNSSKYTKQLKEAEKRRSDCQETIHTLQVQQNAIEYEKRESESSLNAPLPEVTNQADELERLRLEIEAKTQERNSLLERKCDQDQKTTNLSLRGLDEEIKRLNAQQEELTGTKSVSETKQAKLDRVVKQKQASKAEALRIQQEARKRWKSAETQAKDLKKDAESRCSRLDDITETAAELQEQLSSIDKDYLDHTADYLKRDNFYHKYKETKANADKVAHEISLMDELINRLLPVLQTQTRYFKYARTTYGTNIKQAFKAIIRERGYTGDLSVNHEEKTLMCYVTLDKAADTRAKKNLELKNGAHRLASKKGVEEFASSMSGGERSFTTICFLVACWQQMDAPFFIVDEFDVFMDGYNRKKSQEMLMLSAKTKPNSQFFIFTPLELDCNTPIGSKIIRLKKGNSSKALSYDDLDQSELPSLLSS